MTETSAAALPTTASKGDTSGSESVAATEISECSLDVMAPSGAPFSKMFSCCLSKASKLDEEDEEDENQEAEEMTGIEVDEMTGIEVDEVTGIEIDELIKGDEPIVEKTREIELEEEPVPEAPTKFAIGKAVMSFAVVGATVGAVVANGLAQAV
jgi:hypothetical protein